MSESAAELRLPAEFSFVYQRCLFLFEKFSMCCFNSRSSAACEGALFMGGWGGHISVASVMPNPVT